MDNALLEKALLLAAAAHKGQTDKAGRAYIFHPLRVAQRCQRTEEKIVALLHDVIEDSAFSADDLRAAGFPEEIVEAVLAVTRREGECYEEFIMRANQNAIGRHVKLHDIEDNMDITRLDHLTADDLERLNRYLKAYRYLLAPHA